MASRPSTNLVSKVKSKDHFFIARFSDLFNNCANSLKYFLHLQFIDDKYLMSLSNLKLHNSCMYHPLDKYNGCLHFRSNKGQWYLF